MVTGMYQCAICIHECMYICMYEWMTGCAMQVCMYRCTGKYFCMDVIKMELENCPACQGQLVYIDLLGWFKQTPVSFCNRQA